MQSQDVIILYGKSYQLVVISDKPTETTKLFTLPDL